MSEDSGDTELDGEEELQIENDDLTSVGLHFNLNYFRPHTFGLEAELELAALVRRFDLFADDPQAEGMGRDRYSSEGFLRGWNAGNRFGHLAFLSGATPSESAAKISQLNVLPQQVLETYWRWNYERHNLEAELIEDLYLSVVRLGRVENSLFSFAVWGDAIPQAIPEVDCMVLVSRELLSENPSDVPETRISLVSFDLLRPFLSLAEEREFPVRHYAFNYQKPPAELEDFFLSQPSFEGKIEGVSWDRVLTAEIVEEVAASLANQ